MSIRRLDIPDGFREKILRTFKEEGRDWLEGLPDLAEEFIRRWELGECKPEENLSYHYICYAHSPEYGGVVLKIGVPHLELFSGIEALRLYDGRYACKLYEADREKGAMLMERITPGSRLRDEAGFEKRMAVGTELARLLPIPVHGKNDFPVYQKQLEKAFGRARRENRAGGEFISMLDIAEKLYKEIKELHRPEVLLHGDLHHENILMDASGGWKAIDPQGRIGEQCLEAGRFLLNEWDWFGGIGDLKHMTRCVDAFAGVLDESRRTIAMSSFLDYALTSCWSLEEGKRPEDLQDALLQMKCLLELIG